MKAIMRDEREMKDSGINGIGSIADEWDIVPLHSFFEPEFDAIVDGPFGSDMKNEEYVDEGVPIVQLGNIQNGNHSLDKVHYITEEKADILKRHNAASNDLVVAKMMPAGKACILSNIYERYVVSADVARIHIASMKDKQFLVYALNCYGVTECAQYANGSTRARVNVSKIKKLKIATPNANERELIVSFLDDNCLKIDTIIAESKASIDEYKELKQAVIYEAVTKGLDKNVEMKDSGVEWVGTLPSHWNYRKLRYSINDIGDIDHYMPESVTNGIPYIMTGDLKKRVSEIDFDKCKHVSRNDYEKLSIKIKAEKGDIIFARYATIGALCYVDIDADFLVSYSCVIIKPNSKSIDSHFLEYYLQSSSFIEEAKRYANSNVQANIGKESMFQVKIALPSLDEQKKIVDFLDLKITCLDNLINEKQNLIEDLEAYKKSLIYEVVTGTRKVVA